MTSPLGIDRTYQVNAQEVSAFKALLEQLREELRAGADTAKEAARPVQLDQSSVGRLSRMDAMQAQAMALETQRRRDLQERRIELALARIAAGNYGICQACDAGIDPRRLRFDPTTTLCITCAGAKEAT